MNSAPNNEELFWLLTCVPLQGDSGPMESCAVGVALLGVGNGHG